MKKLWLLLVCTSLLLPDRLPAQNKLRLIKLLGRESDPARRCRIYDTLSSCYLMDGKSDDSCYAMCEAHLRYSSRSPELYMATLLSNGDKWAYYTGINSAGRLRHAENYYALLLEEAGENHNAVYECKAYAHLASLVRYHQNNALYMAYAASADSVATVLKSDSLHVIAQLVIAQCNLYRNDIVQAFRNISTAADYADALKDSTFKRQCYIQYAALYYKLKMIPDALANISRAFQIDSSPKHFNKFALLEDYGWKAIVHALVPRIGYELARSDYANWLVFCRRQEIYPTWARTVMLYIFNSFIKEKLFPSALKFYRENQEMYSLLIDFKQEYKMTWATARVHYAQSRFIDAEEEIRTVINAVKSKDEQLLIEAQFDLDSILMAQKKYGSAVQLLDTIRSQATDMNVYNDLARAYQNVSLQFAIQGDYRRAYNARKHGDGLRDTVSSLRKEALFNQLRVEQEKLHTESRRQKVDASKTQITRTLYLGGCFLIVLLLGSCAWLATYKVPRGLIRFTVVLSFVLTFEMLSHVLREPLSGLTEGNPITLFLADLAMGALLGIIHERIEEKALKRLGLTPAHEQKG